MSFGNFYEVDDSVRQIFVGCSTKSEWYSVLGKLSLEGCPLCEAEESLQSWELALQGTDGPLAKIFSGELSAERDEFADPDVVFLGAEIVRSIADEMKKKGKVFFEVALNEVGLDEDVWLFEPMHQFFNEAATKYKAVVVLWGG